jgi:membrane glycosyltransferase
MMLIQTGHVVHFLFGFDTGWDPQRRDDGSIPFMAIVRRHRSHVLMGVLTLVSGLLISPSLVAWMSPTIAGLILAIVISWATGQLSIGMAFRKIGLLTTPEERTKPSVVLRANEIIQEMGGLRDETDDGLAILYDDPHLQAAHIAFMQRDQGHQRGHMPAEWALAQSKLQDAETVSEALSWLKPKERMAILNDESLLRRLFALPRVREDTGQQRAVG